MTFGSAPLANSPRPCVIYARYSTDRQDKMRCRDQVTSCCEFAERQGWHVTQVYQDEALSGTLGRVGRPDWDRLLNDIEAVRVPAGAVVLTFAWSRWSRDEFEGAIARMEVQRRGVDVADCRQGIYGRDIGGRVLVTIEEHRSSEFINELKRSIKSGLDARVREGYWTRSTAPYGYRMVRVPRGAGDAASLEPDPLEVPVVLRIFGELASGAGLTQVARGLNVDRVPTRRGGPWVGATIQCIATNPVYMGQIVTYGGRAAGRGNTRYMASRGRFTVYPGQHQAIIPVRLWTEVSQAWMPRPHQAAPRFRVHPLSGHVFCGRCGRPAHVTGGKWPYRNYRCGAYTFRGCGNRALVRITLLEDSVRAWIRGLAADHEARRMAAELLAAEAAGVATATATARAPLEAELKDLEAKADRYLAALEAGNAPAVINRRLTEIEDRASTVRAKLAKLAHPAGPGPAALALAELDRAIEGGHEDLRGAARLIDRIVLPPDPGGPIQIHALGVIDVLEIAGTPKARGPRAAP